MSKFTATCIAGALAAGLSIGAMAQGSATTEVSTAHAHALMAQGATTLGQVQTHLHHVINCLVGPGGAGFDASAGTPCTGQGNGAITDAASDTALAGKLQGALAAAQGGLEATSLATAQADAAKVAAALEAAASH